MLDKDQLVRRNVKDTIVREPVYFFTMVLIAAMMSAFDPLFFSKEVQKNCETVLFVFLGTATILIAMVTAWLVYHMMRRSLKVRSRELGLYMHLMYFGDRFISGDGTFDPEGLETDEGDYDVYYPYDTYMKVSDYNVLLQMLGEKPVRLRGDGYILQIKRRLEPELTDEIRGRTLLCGQKELHCQGVRTVDLGQNGHNGADYVLVVPDDAADHMAPYYSVLAAFTDEEATGALFDRLKDVSDGDEGLYWGSNHSILYVSLILLKKQVETKLKATIVPFIFSCAYVSIVFLCVSISFFASHLIGVSRKDRDHYLILARLGMERTRVDALIHKQLVITHLIPLGMALIPGCLIAYRASKGFILATGLRTVWVRYVLLSFLWVLMLYILYFILTDIFFRRNIHHGKDGGLL